MNPIGIITLQPSLKDEDNRFKLFSDSNWNYVCNIISGLQYHYHNLDIVLLIPKTEQLNYKYDKKDYSKYSTASINWERVIIQEYFYCPQIFLSRHHFDSQAALQICKRYKPVFIWTTDPCQAIAWKTVFHYSNSSYSENIICSNNFISSSKQKIVPNNLNFLMSQIEGVIHSRITFFNSSAGINIFRESVAKHLNSSSITQLLNKCKILYPGIDIEFIDRLRTTDNSIRNQENTENKKLKLILNHRLNKSDFYKSNWQQAFSLLKVISDEGYVFDLICTDSVSTKQQENLKNKYPFIHFIVHPSYREYIQTLWTSDIAMGFFKIESMWSISLVEAMATYCATILPNHSGFLEMTSSEYAAKTDPRRNLKLLRSLIENIRFRQEIATAGASYVRKKFSNLDVISSVRNLLDPVILGE